MCLCKYATAGSGCLPARSTSFERRHTVEAAKPDQASQGRSRQNSGNRQDASRSTSAKTRVLQVDVCMHLAYSPHVGCCLGKLAVLELQAVLDAGANTEL